MLSPFLYSLAPHPFTSFISVSPHFFFFPFPSLPLYNPAMGEGSTVSFSSEARGTDPAAKRSQCILIPGNLNGDNRSGSFYAHQTVRLLTKILQCWSTVLGFCQILPFLEFCYFIQLSNRDSRADASLMELPNTPVRPRRYFSRICTAGTR